MSDNLESEEEYEKPPIKKLKLELEKVSKPGIIYLSIIPPKMNVKQVREYFSQFGEIHRSYLQPEKKPGMKGYKKSKRNPTYTEGWIEFRKRRHAKRVAKDLNNTPVGGKKKKLHYDTLWNIKYLSGFQWVHLNERLAYERISLQQKLRTEISAAKRETAYFAKSVDLHKKRQKNKAAASAAEDEKNPSDKKLEKATPLAKIDSEKGKSKIVNQDPPPRKTGDRTAFLQSLFGNK